MEVTYWIVNLKTQKYLEVENPDFEGEWKELYTHTKGVDWPYVCVYRLWDHDQVNGIHYVYDLVRDGGIFFLLVDRNKNKQDQIAEAVHQLKSMHDVVHLYVLRFTHA